MKHGESQPTKVITPLGEVTGTLTCVDWNHYRLSLPVAGANLAATWLRDLSDTYTSFNLDGAPDGTPRRMPGPIVVIEDVEAKPVHCYWQPCQRDPNPTSLA